MLQPKDSNFMSDNTIFCRFYRQQIACFKFDNEGRIASTPFDR